MLFNTLDFAIFLPLFFVAYLATRKHIVWRNLLILGGSYLFYGWWDVRFLQLIVISTAVDYVAALLIERGRVTARARLGVSCFVLAGALGLVGVDWSGGLLSPSLFATSQAAWIVGICATAVVAANAVYPLLAGLRESARRRTFLTLSIVANLGILATFKYFDFFAGSLSNALSSTFGVTPSDWTLGFVLPVGISFYTFQTMSYSIDVYRGKTPASDRFIDVAAYVAFFPQLVAGPIERASQLLPQFKEIRPPLDVDRFRRAAWLITWGLFELVVADNMAVVVNATFDLVDGGDYTLPPDGRLYWCPLRVRIPDLRRLPGYTDIAEASRLLGLSVRNFDLPTSRPVRPTSGGGGTSASPPGFATTCTSRSAATRAARGGPTGTRSCSSACGTGGVELRDLGCLPRDTALHLRSESGPSRVPILDTSSSCSAS